MDKKPHPIRPHTPGWRPVEGPPITLASSDAPVPPPVAPLLPEVPQHVAHGNRWHAAGRCVTCGGPRDDAAAYHCDRCYAALYSTLADYDDD